MTNWLQNSNWDLPGSPRVSALKITFLADSLGLSTCRFCFRHSIVFYLFIGWLTASFSANSVLAQETINYGVFSKDALGGVQVNLPIPGQIKVVGLSSLSSSSQTSGAVNNSSPGTGKLIGGFQPQLLNNMPSANSAQNILQQSDIERELWLNEIYKKEGEKEAAIRPYREAFAKLSGMNPDHFSLSQAIYEIENAYLEKQLTQEGFNHALQARVDQVHQILKKQGLSFKNNLSVNYAIQQLFEHPNIYYDGQTQLTHTVPPLKYDFDDYMGQKDYTKLFASKLLATGSGQCHSLPLVYLMIAEQLGAKAWLSLAPEHSFVQFMDSHGRLLDYESSVLLFFIAVCQVVMAKTLFIAKLLLNKVTDPMTSYSNITKIPDIS